MPIIRHGSAVADDWTLIGPEDADAALSDGDVIVPLARLDDALAVERNGRVGVDIGNDADTGTLQGLVGRVDLIQIDFPSFADGRGFSLAKRLRNLGFEGVLRAHGPLIADQAAFAESCGFDEIAIDDLHAARQAAEHFAEIRSVFATTYQEGLEPAGAKRSILSARHAAG